MSTQTDLNLAQFLASGPDLLLQNPFRLAQMPVDVPERKLTKRQQTIDVARKMELDIPDGPCPIFPIADQSGDALKEALHRMRDPANRLLSEFFWFWPRTFGDGENDRGLQCLAKGSVEEAIENWKSGELETENYVSTHNLAVLYQFLAVQTDAELIESGSPLKLPSTAEKGGLLQWGKQGMRKLYHRNSPEETSRRYWKESFDRWVLLSKQDSFWRFVKGRIVAMADHRLPVERSEWFREHELKIVCSVNAALILRASDRVLVDHVERQRAILKASGFGQDLVLEVLDNLTAAQRQRVKRLCQDGKAEATRDPRRADVQARKLAQQAEPVLAVLDRAYPPGTRAIESLHDEVAESILETKMAYGRKTQNWSVSLELGRLAQAIARGEALQLRVKENLAEVQQLQDSGDDWCLAGYFDLPDECIDVLENARAYEESGRHDQALENLRKALFGLTEVPQHPDFFRYHRHCMAYCLKVKSVSSYNRAHDDFDTKFQQALQDSLQRGRAGTLLADPMMAIRTLALRIDSLRPMNVSNLKMCVSCRQHIMEQTYFKRTIGGQEHSFCNSCNARLNREIEVLETEFDAVRQQSLDLLTLSRHLNPAYKAAIRDFETIQKAAQARNITAKGLHQLKVQWNLFDAEECIGLLTGGTGGTDADPTTIMLFANLSRIIAMQGDEARATTLGRLFDATTKSVATVSRVLPLLFNDDYIFGEFIKQVLVSGGSGSAGKSAVIEVLTITADYGIKFSVAEQLERYCGEGDSVVAMIIASLDPLVGRLALADGALSLQTGALSDLLSRAYEYDPILEKPLVKHLIKVISQSGSDTKIEDLFREIERRDRCKEWFYRFVFLSEDDAVNRDAINRCLQKTRKLSLQFQTLEHLRGVLDDASPVVKGIRSSVKITIVALTESELGVDPMKWLSGDLSFAFTHAADYDAGFEQELFAAVAAKGAGNEGLATKVLRALTARPRDKESFLALLARPHAALEDTGKLLYYRLMVFHWDPEIRLVGLQGVTQLGDVGTKVPIYIQALADLDGAVRGLAESQLTSHPNESCALAFEACYTQDALQQAGLARTLIMIRPHVSLASVPPYDVLICLLSLSDSVAISEPVKDYIEKFHTEWTGQWKWTLRFCLQWLKYAANNKEAESTGPAKELLATYTSKSFLSRFFVWSRKPIRPSPGYVKEWWRPSPLKALTVSGTNARTEDKRQQKQEPAKKSEPDKSGSSGKTEHQFDARGICSRCGYSSKAVENFGFKCTLA